MAVGGLAGLVATVLGEDKWNVAPNGHRVGQVWGECTGPNKYEVTVNPDLSYSRWLVRQNSPSCGYEPQE